MTDRQVEPITFHFLSDGHVKQSKRCLCLGGERAAAGEPGQRGEAAADGRAVRVALPAAARLDVPRQEVRVAASPPPKLCSQKQASNLQE